MNERGSVTFWMLGLAIALLTVGVLSVDLWALIGERRELTAVADAAASLTNGLALLRSSRPGHEVV